MTDQVSAAIIRSNPPALGVPPGCSRVVEVRGGRSIFIAGPTALDRNGEVVGKGNFARQAARVFENLAIALQSAGCTAANLIKLTVFLRNINDRSAPYGLSDAPPIAKARFLNTANGGSPRSRTRETQSMVFFRSGVTDALYSGLAMNTPECSDIIRLRLRAGSGTPDLASASPS